MARKYTVIRECPVCYTHKAQIEITETGNAKKGITETWKHVGRRCRKKYKVS